MKGLAVAMASLLFAASACVRAKMPAATSNPEVHMVTLDDVRRVSPALEKYAQDAVLGDLWKRPGLAPRDRSIVTVAALIARNHAIEMPYHVNRALDNGIAPGELSEIITHLAFYSGWANATSAVAVAKDVFDRRHIREEQLPPAAGPRLPLDEAAEALRAAGVAENVGPVAPGLERYTTDVLFRDLWLRPGLAPRDRSLVTVSAHRSRARRADPVSPEQGDGQRPDEGGGVGVGQSISVDGGFTMR